MEFPALIVNFKAYAESVGEGAMELAEVLARVREETGREVIAVPQLLDLKGVAGKVPSFAQHIDPVNYGSRTGHVLPEGVLKAGGIGTLINHSERRLDLETVGKAVARAKEAGLISCVCAATPEEAERIAGFSPDIIAVEPPELIGSGVSVSNAKPEVVSDSVKVIKGKNPDIRVLCGAGVSTGGDVRKAVGLGAEGVLVASAIIKAEDRHKIALEMANGLEGEK